MATGPDETAVRAAPVAAKDRIFELDVLRGAALFGILAANLRGFSAPLDAYFDIGRVFPGPADRAVQFVIDVLIQRKFVTIFSFLFGVGFELQCARSDEAEFAGLYRRRLLGLALFGLVHGIAIWAGDILLTYAIAGVFLLSYRKMRVRELVGFAGVILVAMGLAIAVEDLRHAPSHHEPLEEIIRVYSRGSLAEMARQNWAEWLEQLSGQGFAAYAAAMGLLGVATVRMGVMEHPGRWRETVRRVAWWTLPPGLLLNVVGALLPQRWLAWKDLTDFYSAPVLACGYVCGFSLLIARREWWLKAAPLAAVGRMALTNYLMQSAVCVAFFRLTHLYGVWGPAMDLLPTMVLFAAQIVFSNLWLRRYRFGPAEWLWRRMTYGSLGGWGRT